MRRSRKLGKALAPHIGYDKATEIAKTAHKNKNGTTLKQEAINLGYVSEQRYEAIVSPRDMIKPED